MKELVTQPQFLAQLGSCLLPALIDGAGERASYKFVEFFTARLANDNTRRAYARTAYRFLAWCDARGLELSHIHPVATAGYNASRLDLPVPSTDQS